VSNKKENMQSFSSSSTSESDSDSSSSSSSPSQRIKPIIDINPLNRKEVPPPDSSTATTISERDINKAIATPSKKKKSEPLPVAKKVRFSSSSSSELELDSDSSSSSDEKQRKRIKPKKKKDDVIKVALYKPKETTKEKVSEASKTKSKKEWNAEDLASMIRPIIDVKKKIVANLSEEDHETVMKHASNYKTQPGHSTQMGRLFFFKNKKNKDAEKSFRNQYGSGAFHSILERSDLITLPKYEKHAMLPLAELAKKLNIAHREKARQLFELIEQGHIKQGKVKATTLVHEVIIHLPDQKKSYWINCVEGRTAMGPVVNAQKLVPDKETIAIEILRLNKSREALVEIFLNTESPIKKPSRAVVSSSKSVNDDEKKKKKKSASVTTPTKTTDTAGRHSSKNSNRSSLKDNDKNSKKTKNKVLELDDSSEEEEEMKVEKERGEEKKQKQKKKKKGKEEREEKMKKERDEEEKLVNNKKRKRHSEEDDEKDNEVAMKKKKMVDLSKMSTSEKRKLFEEKKKSLDPATYEDTIKEARHWTNGLF